MEQTDKYEAVIGLEVHIQLSTSSKAFCSDSTIFGGEPNSQTSIVSLAHPGTLPRPNKAQVDYAIKLGHALGCSINPLSFFDRKHYFYADLPKGFQTTQDNAPICVGGQVTFLVEGELQTIRLHHIHMEEDAGKSLHDMDSRATFIDLNRAGVPLLEMVTEPDFRSASQVYYFINDLRRLVRYLEISDGNMEEGSLRCDCNVSVRLRGSKELNPRSEVKNINSARFAKRAIEFEIDRQIGMMERGESVTQETREFLVDKGITTNLRNKEDAHDYRYFSEPDILPVKLEKSYIDHLKQSLPTLPNEHRLHLSETLNINPDDIEVIIETKERAEAFSKFVEVHPKIEAQMAANFFVNKWFPAKNMDQITDDITYGQIAQFLSLIADGKIAASVAYQKLWPALLEAPGDVDDLCQRLNLLQTSDSDEIENLVLSVIEENPKQVAQYKKGKKGVITFFMGQVMRKSKGKANPALARQALERHL